MNKQAGMKWCLALCLSLVGTLSQGLRAEGAPAAMKYQAVLRDVEGKPMADREHLGVRITLRQNSPTGPILYQETHTEIKTDAFGLMQLEIGRGEVSEEGSRNLLKVPWNNSPIYAQVEVENDENGFTAMGASELLSVPYALFAGNAGGGLDLTDGFLPKYNGVSREFEDSKIKENPMEFIEFYPGNQSYSFPKTRGKEGEVLILLDGDGVLGWRSSSDSNKCMDCKDDYLTYWDKVDKVWRTTKMRYIDNENTVYAESKFVTKEPLVVENGLEINTRVTGNHNLQYDSLNEYFVWVGGDNQKAQPYKLGVGITIDSTSNSDYRLLTVNSAVAAWERRNVNNIEYVHTKIDRPVMVGVGLNTPQTRFHVQDGSFLLSDSTTMDGSAGSGGVGELWKGHHFYWNGAKGALRMGKFDQASSLWANDIGEGSIALGTEATAQEDDNVAIGAGTHAVGVSSLAIGHNVQAGDAANENSVALGNNVLVTGKNAVGIGNGSVVSLNNAAFYAKGENSVAIGYDVKNEGGRSVAIGQDNIVKTKSSVMVGDQNTFPKEADKDGSHNVAIGTDNKVTDGTTPFRTILMGQNNYLTQAGQGSGQNQSTDVITMGMRNRGIRNGRCISIGFDLTTNNNDNNVRSCINIGSNNEINNSGGTTQPFLGPILIGKYLKNYSLGKVTVVGHYNRAPSQTTLNPAFIVGVGAGGTGNEKNALELYDNGNLYLIGDVAKIYLNNVELTSDRRLKTDIEPLNADFSVLKSLSPMRYRLTADPKQALQFGFIAQDVERYFPHLVDTDTKGMKSLNYIGLLPVLWQYTQQLEKTVSDQAAEIERLRTETEALRSDMKAVKAKLGLE